MIFIEYRCIVRSKYLKNVCLKIFFIDRIVGTQQCSVDSPLPEAVDIYNGINMPFTITIDKNLTPTAPF